MKRIEEVKNVAVIGAGNMGHQLSTLCALSGFETFIVDENPAQIEKAKAFVADYLPGRVKKGRITQEHCDDAMSKLHFAGTMEEAVPQADIVVEAVFEKLEVKRAVFTKVNILCKKDALMVTNSGFLPSSLMADCLDNPSALCNMHFFNPALVMKGVEVMRGEHTCDEAFELAVAFAEKLGKIPTRIVRELEGMIANRISTAVLNTATEILEAGYATAQDIDSICQAGLGYPMGPFKLLDLTGIDLAYMIKMENFRKSGNWADLPSPTIVEHYVKGEYGRKTKKGFYEYP